MLTEQEFFDEDAWDNWKGSNEELQNLYEMERERLWKAFNKIFANKLYGVSESTKSYLFEDFKHQYFANRMRDKEDT
ncbi:hypothetical protein [Lactovum miscens]|uniref:Uncharacterized protein n=1 Tax=Lactovum miscens TaxID=190387 RepID=A0A841C8Z5_9LACT|nr:hypothetical protein [Lactovum miscens]MBB5888777.1 hypothetical protein [Lactovum miscens]